MSLFSSYFNIPYSQAQLDFFDCDINEDRQLYVDPFAISQMSDHWAGKCQVYLESYFKALLKVLGSGDQSKIIQMTSHFGEPGDTFIGMSAGRPQGRGVGAKQANQIVKAISGSRAVRTGLLSDLAELPMFIEGIDKDKISDLTTNIIRDVLYDYTIDQCNLHSVPMMSRPCPSFWSLQHQDWVTDYRLRPVINNQEVLLLPKRILRHNIALRGKAFYNSGMIDFLKAEHVAQKTKIVYFNKSQNKFDATKKAVKNEHPFSKDFVASFVDNNPNVYRDYKRNLSVEHAVNLVEICTPKGAVLKFNAGVFAKTLAGQLKSIPTGKKAANDFHEFILGALTFLFYPHLTNPAKETPLNAGRKRVDITFDNTAESGFFRRMADDNSIGSKIVMIECKNYKKKIANPEFDQLIGRLSPKTGKFGILVCRNDDKPDVTLKRTKDALHSDQGHVLVLKDDDVIKMLEAYVDGHSTTHLQILQKKFRELIL